MANDRFFGAVAVVLGVGAAMITAPPPVQAQPSDTDSTSNSTSSGGEGPPASSPAENNDASSPPSASSSPKTESNSPSPEEDSMKSDTESAPASADPDAPSSADEAAASESESTATPEATAAEPAPIAEASAETSDTTSDNTSTAPKPAATKQETVVADTTKRDPAPKTSDAESTPASPTGRSVVAATPEVQAAALAVAAAEASTTPSVTTRTTTLTTPDLTVPRGTIADIVTTLLSWVGLAPPAAGSPPPPIQFPILWGVVAWVRREIQQFLCDVVGISHPQQLTSLPVDPQSPNLLVNPGAEFGDASLSGYSSVTVPGWSVTGTPTVIQYGTLRRLPLPLATPGPTLPEFLGFPRQDWAPPNSGLQFFGGGNVATSSLTQTVDLTAAASTIDGGCVTYTLSGWLGGFTLDPSAASVTVNFLDEDGLVLGNGKLTPITAWDRWFRTGLLERQTWGLIPEGTRRAQVAVTFTDGNLAPGSYNNAYADNLSFTIGANLPAPAAPTPPASRVGQLDHVFMVYMENKGYTEIVGSPNAPYLNSLIDTYGVGTNYYALTHPSSPNYYPILGGSDFGLNYNCPSDCFDAPNLADNIEAVGKTWAGYLQGGGGYAAPADLPFLAFRDIYDDPARVATHLFDLPQLAQDLAVPADAPNFVWIGANDATNMEGPTDTLLGVLQWAISQLTDHQYNVAAGDKWLQDSLAMVVNSPTWLDPTQKSAVVVTFDEDNDNLSLGIGNQGNHIVTIVIPSPGAVAAGMRDGHFEAGGYNNHYSLLRMIEDSLGVAPLTHNDKYAEPMNDYWNTPITV